MTVSVLIPFRSDDPHRVAALGRVATGYLNLGWQVVFGAEPGPWCKASAVTECLRSATGDILVVADADCLCAGTEAAVHAVEDGARWSMPHQRVHRLTPDATARVLAGAAPDLSMATTERPYLATFGGGIVALHRDLYERVPLDPRFVGWGQEDESWAMALDTLAGPCTQLDAPLFHLWHAPAERRTRKIGNEAGRQLHRRYWQAKRDPEVMRSLLEEARCAVSSI